MIDVTRVETVARPPTLKAGPIRLMSRVTAASGASRSLRTAVLRKPE